MNKWAIGGIVVAVIAIAVVANNRSQESQLDSALQSTEKEADNLFSQGKDLVNKDTEQAKQTATQIQDTAAEQAQAAEQQIEETAQQAKAAVEETAQAAQQELEKASQQVQSSIEESLKTADSEGTQAAADAEALAKDAKGQTGF